MPFKPTEREYRSMPIMTPDDNERRILRGYACTFEDAYELFSDDRDIVKEIISRDAFDGCSKDDTILQLNHEGPVYARTKNSSLIIKPDEHGLFMEAELQSERGRLLYEDVRLGLLTQMSFGFVVGSGNDEWDHEQIDPLTGRRIHLRRINKIKRLFDVSVVNFPANPNTEVMSVRNYVDGVIAEFNQEFDKRKLEELRIETERQRALLRARLLQFTNGGK